MFGLKIYADKNKLRMQEIIEYAVENDLGMEVFLVNYRTRSKMPFEEFEWVLSETDFKNIKDKSYHHDNLYSYGSKLDDVDTLNSFAAEMQDAKRLGIDKTVMHYTECFDKEIFTQDKIKSDLKRVQELAEENDVIVHLENTLFKDGKVTVDFHDIMFKEVAERDYKNIGFCFDIGHAKVFSDDILHDWLAFLDRLEQNNIPLHFHLHNNNGLTDQHLSYRETEEKGLNEGDDFTTGQYYLDVIANIEQKYRGLKVFEVKAAEGIRHIEWLKSKGLSLGRMNEKKAINS